MSAEHQRLKYNSGKRIPLAQWGPYVSERQWGTVREDYSEYGDAWNYFPFEHAHFRSYMWGEDGIAGISDMFQNLCFSVAMWNGKDTILKERLFGLGNSLGNHGEDVKEIYHYLDNIPTHYYMEYLYKYPQNEFPYELLISENRKRSAQDPEYEILDTGIFDNNEYFDILITYAKKTDNDIYVKISTTNRNNKSKEITILPTIWFRNQLIENNQQKPTIVYLNKTAVMATHKKIGNYYLYFQQPAEVLFTDNETNTFKLNGKANKSIYTKDAFNDAIIKGENVKALKSRKLGTKCSVVYKSILKAGETMDFYCRISNVETEEPFPERFDQIFNLRKEEADDFYEHILPRNMSKDMKIIQRQAIAGLLWSKQFYYYDIEKWLNQSNENTSLNKRRLNGRNHEWTHLKNQDIILMPDKWEYPWYAAWDLAFQCISMANVDANFSKHQLLLIMREWYMHPNGQLPAYEWNFSDVNPPVHAWAAYQVYQIDKKQNNNNGDIIFLKKIFQKLLINFTWWINRKDRKGNNLFEGGFLGLDNIGVFNRSFTSGEMELEQADGTSWMGTYALNMMDIALEIAQYDESFEDTATKFFEHFVLIAEALNEHHLWNEQDKFFYDVLSVPGADPKPLQIKSIVGLTSLFAVSMINKKTFAKLKDFQRRTSWFENYRKKNNKFWPNEERGDGEEILISLVPKEKLIFLLERLLDENEFLSPFGIRALSKFHRDHPYSVSLNGHQYTISYDPGDSTSDIFGGNSNWRGPVWMPINYLIIQSIRRFGTFYGDNLLVNFPTGSDNKINLCQVADGLTERIISLFEKDEKNHRKLYNSHNSFFSQKNNEDLILFYEYFHGDSGKGLGASHQTGWTALIAELIRELSESTSKANSGHH